MNSQVGAGAALAAAMAVARERRPSCPSEGRARLPRIASLVRVSVATVWVRNRLPIRSSEQCVWTFTLEYIQRRPWLVDALRVHPRPDPRWDRRPTLGGDACRDFLPARWQRCCREA